MTRHSSIRAIQTRYKGYAFRSRLEARWAVFFDHLKIKWEYEPEGFDLGNGLRYLPDFWLPDLGLWVEVKPGEPDDAAREKAVRLVLQGGKPMLIAQGMPDESYTFFAPRNDIDFGGRDVSEHRASVAWHEPNIYLQEPAPEMAFPRFMAYPMGKLDCEIYGDGALALNAARSARFEFGRAGAV